MLVQLKSIQTVIVDGNLTRCYPGDWVEVGKQTALRWLETDEAWRPKAEEHLVPDNSAVIADDVLHAQSVLREHYPLLNVVGSLSETTAEHLMFWKTEAALRPYLLAIGLDLTLTWEMAAPLYDYTTLANEVGTEEERALTAERIGDLRVMLYDPRLIFMRRTPDTERFMTLLSEEEGHPQLSFLRVLHAVQPLMMALPVTWLANEA